MIGTAFPKMETLIAKTKTPREAIDLYRRLKRDAAVNQSRAWNYANCQMDTEMGFP